MLKNLVRRVNGECDLNRCMLHLLGHALCPDGQVCRLSQQQITGHRRQMMNEPELVLGVFVRLWGWEELEIRAREAAGLLPEVDVGLAPWCQGEGGLFRAVLTFRVRPNTLHVVASDLVFGAVLAERPAS